MHFNSPDDLYDALPASRRRLLQALGGWGAVAALGLGACSREEPGGPWQGARFPPFALPALDGRLHTSADFAGQAIFLNFWATWCPPCRAEMADLDALNRSLAPRGLRLFAISVDRDINLVREFVMREKLGLPVLLDADQQWSKSAVKVPGFPTTYMVGRDGIIKDAVVGVRAWADKDVQADVARTLALHT